MKSQVIFKVVGCVVGTALVLGHAVAPHGQAPAPAPGAQGGGPGGAPQGLGAADQPVA